MLTLMKLCYGLWQAQIYKLNLPENVPMSMDLFENIMLLKKGTTRGDDLDFKLILAPKSVVFRKLDISKYTTLHNKTSGLKTF